MGHVIYTILSSLVASLELDDLAGKYQSMNWFDCCNCRPTLVAMVRPYTQLLLGWCVCGRWVWLLHVRYQLISHKKLTRSRPFQDRIATSVDQQVDGRIN